MNKFYHFTQNNSGGSYDIDANVNKLVIIEAGSADEANQIAKAIGIYFDGVVTGRDCSCCGSRWYPVSEYDAQDQTLGTHGNNTVIHRK